MVPVVSYAPRPMIVDDSMFLVIIWQEGNVHAVRKQESVIVALRTMYWCSNTKWGRLTVAAGNKYMYKRLAGSRFYGKLRLGKIEVGRRLCRRDQCKGRKGFWNARQYPWVEVEIRRCK